MTTKNRLPDIPPPEPVTQAAAAFGICKGRLYGIAEVLDAEGYKSCARDVRATADFIDELMSLPGADGAFAEVLAEWGRQIPDHDVPDDH